VRTIQDEEFSSLKILPLSVHLIVDPIFGLTHNMWFQTLMIGTFIYLIVDAGIIMSSFRSYGMYTFKNFRLRIKETDRIPLTSADLSNLRVEINLLSAGCPIQSASSHQMNASASELLLINSALEITIDGFTLNAASSFSALSPSWSSTIFVLDGFAAGQWTRIGQTTSFRKQPYGIKFMDNEINTAVNEGIQKYDFRASAPMFIESCMNSIILACFVLTAIVSPLTSSRSDAVKLWWKALCILLFLNQTIAGIGYLVDGYQREPFAPFSTALLYLLVLSSLWVADYLLISAWMAISGLGLILSLLDNCFIFRDCAPSPRDMGLCIGLLVGAGLVFVKHREHRHATRLFRAIRAQQDAMRQQVIQRPESAAALHSVNAVLQALSSTPDEARQLNRRIAEPDPAPGGGGNGNLAAGAAALRRVASADRFMDFRSAVAGTADSDLPVTSLYQLYAQAACAACLLEPCAAAWAALSRGSVTKPAGNLDLDPGPLVALPPTVAALVRRGTLKHPLRAHAEALVCYGGDVSRLLDVCRARIIFDGLSDLLACLELVAAHGPELRVVRVRSGLQDGSCIPVRQGPAAAWIWIEPSESA
jgi:hypothetical protein